MFDLLYFIAESALFLGVEAILLLFFGTYIVKRVLKKSQ